MIVLLSILSVLVLGVYLYASQKKTKLNEDLGLIFTEVVSLQELLENEREETKLLANQFDQILREFKEAEITLETTKEQVRKNEAELHDLELGIRLLSGNNNNNIYNPQTKDINEIVQDFITPSTTPDSTTEFRRVQVKEAFLHAWNGYKNYAWGKDDLKPISKSYANWLDLSVTMVDALDTLWIMDLHDEFNLARDWIDLNLSFENNNHDMSLFETTIRELGGLLSAYELSKDKMFLDKAEDLGQRLLKGFSDPSGIPHAAVNLATGKASSPSWIRNKSILSEMGTLQLEFLYLAYHTNNPDYAVKPMNVFRHLDSLEKSNGLYPLYIDRNSGNFIGREISFGALGDSFYEYMLKLWIFTNKEADGYRRMYEESTTGAMERLILTSKSGYRYLGQINSGGGISTKMEHLTCFAGGMFALGSVNDATPNADDHLSVGADLTTSCHQAYDRTATHIGPETFEFTPNAEFIVPTQSRYYILRPEVIESYFILWRTTKDPKYREWAWEAFQAIEKHCKVDGGFSGIHNVDQVPVSHDDTQQSFFLAETLKYLYLIFSDDSLIPLDKYVFNTEAHPLGIPNESIFTWPQELQFLLLTS